MFGIAFRRTLFHRVVVAATVAVAPAAAQAVTIFSSLGAGGSYSTTGQFNIVGLGSPIFTPMFAFVAAESATLNQIDFAERTDTNGTLNALVLSSSNGAPGTVLGRFALTPVTSGLGLATATGLSGLDLVAGTTYFLGLQAPNGQFAELQNSTGYVGVIYDQTLTNTPTFQGTQTSAAFDLIGAAAVPEPGSLALVGSAIAALVPARRRRRRADGRPDVRALALCVAGVRTVRG